MAPLPRFDKLPADKQRRILDAAAREFGEHGYEAASLNRIIADAEISKGAMYYYFADKADLYGAVMEDVVARVAAGLDGFAAPRDAEAFWLELSELTARVQADLFADPQAAALARGLYRSGGGNPVYQDLMARSAASVGEVLAAGRAVGAVRDDVPLELLTEALTGMLVHVDRWFAEAMEREDPAVLLPLVPKVLELVRALVGPSA